MYFCFKIINNQLQSRAIKSGEILFTSIENEKIVWIKKKINKRGTTAGTATRVIHHCRAKRLRSCGGSLVPSRGFRGTKGLHGATGTRGLE